MEDSYYKKTESLFQGYIQEVDFLMQAQKYQLSFLMMSQIIEVLGAFIDDKPFRAKDQSQKRFNLALKKLLKSQYFKVNDKNFLYIHYRCNMSHLLTTSTHILLSNIHQIPQEQHLSIQNGKLILLAEPLLSDIKLSIEKLLKKIETGDIKEKKGLSVQESGI
jgi:hypothetical protein